MAAANKDAGSGADGNANEDEATNLHGGGCDVTSRSSSGSPFVLAALGALVLSARRRKKNGRNAP